MPDREVRHYCQYTGYQLDCQIYFYEKFDLLCFIMLLYNSNIGSFQFPVARICLGVESNFLTFR